MARQAHRAARSWVFQSEGWLPWAMDAAIAARASEDMASGAPMTGPLDMKRESARDWLLSVSPVSALRPALSRLACGTATSTLAALIGATGPPAAQDLLAVGEEGDMVFIPVEVHAPLGLASGECQSATLQHYRCHLRKKRWCTCTPRHLSTWDSAQGADVGQIPLMLHDWLTVTEASGSALV